MLRLTINTGCNENQIQLIAHAVEGCCSKLVLNEIARLESATQLRHVAMARSRRQYANIGST